MIKAYYNCHQCYNFIIEALAMRRLFLGMASKVQTPDKTAFRIALMPLGKI